MVDKNLISRHSLLINFDFISVNVDEYSTLLSCIYSCFFNNNNNNNKNNNNNNNNNNNIIIIIIIISSRGSNSNSSRRMFFAKLANAKFDLVVQHSWLM